MNNSLRQPREFGYVVGGIRNMQEYAKALGLIGKQLGRDPVHRYRFDQDAGIGALTFTSPVEIDIYPLQEAGFTAEKRERPQAP